MPLSLGSRVELLAVPDHTRADMAALVERYRGHRDEYQSAEYKEAQLRQEFLNPFFAALGWDMDNKRGYAEPYKEVVHEDSLRVEGAMKAPDYCFRYGGIPKFFVEAKSPSTNVKGDPGPAYQLRRYGWSAHLPLSILTDFEEFTVYDCREKPSPDDAPAHARVAYLTFEEYLDDLPQIYSLFSYEAIPRGVFDRWAESTRGKRGTETVDAAFLKEIEGWRDALARNIALRNDISVDDLNFAVQSLIDRLLFFRIAEDRGVERYGQLQEFAEQADLYSRLSRLFSQADDKYNSGLFDFSESGDQFTPDLAVDDKVIKPIIADLYYPKSPYEFSVIGADILGAVYEQFLGKVIRLTKGGRAKVEEKPEVKKAGGVYYTPRYIVDYIVEHTVGEAVQAAGTPKKLAALRILDPACGSGSFLLGAYQWLLNWHLDYYRDHDPQKLSRKRKPVIVPTEAGDWRLSTAERKRILLANIYGVDLDPQAVEVTKLNLLLKCLEGETQRSLEAQLPMFHDRALPNIDGNVKCGNSLIGPDYFTGRLDYDEEERRRVNPFDWEAEFAEIMEAGGFDCVIGNPPYIRIHNLVDYYPGEVRYIQANYATAAFGKVDIYVAFVEMGMRVLGAEGILGFILPNKFFQANYGVGLRRLLTSAAGVKEIVDFNAAQVFAGATTYTCLLFLSPQVRESFTLTLNPNNEAPQALLASGQGEESRMADVGEGPWILASNLEREICTKIVARGRPLGSMAKEIITGVKTGANKVFVLEPEEAVSLPVEEQRFLKPFAKARDLKRYAVSAPSLWLVYPYELADGRTTLVPEERFRQAAPRLWQRLEANRRTLEGRQKGGFRGPNWYALSFSSSLTMFGSPKIVTADLAPRNSFGLDLDGVFFPQGAGGGMGIVCDDLSSAYYVLGLLNAQLLTFYMQRISSRFQGGWFAYEPRYVNQLPIRPIDFDDPADVARHDRMVALVQRMLDLHKRLPEAKTPQKRQGLEREIRATDAAIDALVYELYDLTPDEIAIVEDAATPE